YNGFNLLAGDGDALWYFGSREGEVRAVEPGIHALSNHLLDEPWPKVRRARQAMAADVAGDEGALFAMLGDATPGADAELPDTGVGLAWERRLSPALITGADYGTRASTVVRLSAHGESQF
ncbi:MAG TPA: NRDE family protein, partial [Usitatibacteraceae bacterium]|nr:NRDE family protein [Usitatibacteraceae bacterium]